MLQELLQHSQFRVSLRLSLRLLCCSEKPNWPGKPAVRENFSPDQVRVATALKPRTILYYTILYYTILYYTILCYNILHTMLYYTLYYTYAILYIILYSKLYSTLLYSTLLYYTSQEAPRSEHRTALQEGNMSEVFTAAVPNPRPRETEAQSHLYWNPLNPPKALTHRKHAQKRLHRLRLPP